MDGLLFAAVGCILGSRRSPWRWAWISGASIAASYLAVIAISLMIAGQLAAVVRLPLAPVLLFVGSIQIGIHGGYWAGRGWARLRS